MLWDFKIQKSPRIKESYRQNCVRNHTNRLQLKSLLGRDTSTILLPSDVGAGRETVQ